MLVRFVPWFRCRIVITSRFSITRSLCSTSSESSLDIDIKPLEAQDGAKIANLFAKYRNQPFEQEDWNALCARAQSCFTLSAKDITKILNALTWLPQVANRTIQPNAKENLMDHLLSEALSRCADFDETNISTTLKALVKLDCKNKVLLDALFARALTKADQFTPFAIANSLKAQVDFLRMDLNLIRALCTTALRKATHFNVADLIMTLKALNNLNWGDYALHTALCAEVVKKASDFDGDGIAIVMHALAGLGTRDEKTIERLYAQTLTKVNEISPACIHLALTALIKFGLHQSNLVTALLDVAIEKAPNFKARSISMLFAALASFPRQDHVLTQRVFAHFCPLLRTIGSLPSQDIIVILHAMATVDHHDKHLLRHLGKEMLKKTSNLRENEIAIILDSLAHFNMRDETLISQMYKEAVIKASSFTPKSIAFTLRSMTRHYYDEALVRGLCTQASMKASDFGVFYLTITLQALSRLVYYDERVVTSLSQVLTKYQDFSTRTISSILHALATFNTYDEALVKLLCSKLLAKASECNAHNITMSLFSLVVLQHYDASLFCALSESLSKFPEDKLTIDSQGQLALCNLWLSLEGFPQLPYKGKIHPEPTHIGFFEQFPGILNKLGAVKDFEIQGIRVDAALVERRLVVVIARPFYFCRGSNRMTGGALLKHRLLEKMGWQVVNIAFSEWARLTKDDGLEYLQQRLGLYEAEVTRTDVLAEDKIGVLVRDTIVETNRGTP